MLSQLELELEKLNQISMIGDAITRLVGDTNKINSDEFIYREEDNE